jgi:hypothetical protein
MNSTISTVFPVPSAFNLNIPPQQNTVGATNGSSQGHKRAVPDSIIERANGKHDIDPAAERTS